MPQPKSLNTAFELIYRKMLVTFINKHSDYGKGNILDTGELGIAFRINDKLNRLKHILINQKQPQNESMEETWLDIAIYSIIAVLYRKGWFEKLNLKLEQKK